MSQQERRAKAEKKADQEAARVVAEVVDKVTAEKPAAKRRSTLSDEHVALAPKVKDLRERGVAWWQIGFELGLPGSADNVREGKGGAAFARRVYAAAFGEVPRTQVRNGSRSNREKNDDVKAIKKQRKTDRVEIVRGGKAVLREDMTDEEVVETLRGRVIGWSTNISTIWGDENDDPQYAEQEAGVHRRWAKIETHGGDRCIVFKEFDPHAPVKLRAYAGATRIVRVRSIHTVR